MSVAKRSCASKQLHVQFTLHACVALLWFVKNYILYDHKKNDKNRQDKTRRQVSSRGSQSTVIPHQITATAAAAAARSENIHFSMYLRSSLEMTNTERDVWGAGAAVMNIYQQHLWPVKRAWRLCYQGRQRRASHIRPSSGDGSLALYAPMMKCFKNRC